MSPNAARVRIALLLATMAVLAACQPAYFRVLNARVDGDAPHTRVYDAGNRLALDVYPARGGSGNAPVVVFFHGGTWHNGRREFYRFVGDALSAHGVVVVVPDYRKWPGHAYPSFMQDAATATAWTLRHASELGGDPGRVFVMGHSAGAHIAALLGTDARHLARWNLRPRQLAGVIGLAGPYDFLPMKDRRLKRVFTDPALWPESQPVNHVDGDEPPFLLLHGGSDRRVRPRNSQRLAELLQAAGQPVTLRIVHGSGHIGLVNGFYSPRLSPVLEETLRWIAPVGGNTSASAGGASGQAR